VDFFVFDEVYFRRLRERDPQTESHFVAYFRDLLQIKLRSRLHSRQAIDDAVQETFVRVLAVVRSEAGMRQPERLGAFVNSVCNNVLLEAYRSKARNPQEDEERPEQADTTIDLDGFLISEQTSAQVRQVLDQLTEKDRRLLRAVFFEDKDKDTVCGEFGVDRDYLRVLLHRAKQSFKALYEKEVAAGGSPQRAVKSVC
jgi:RNA polymerase sigma-70 factor (ECF subfamily)